MPPTLRSSIGRASAPALAAAMLFCVGCHTNTLSTPTSSTPGTQTESFSGSFGQSGSAAFPFTVASTGTVQVSLTSVAPLSTMALGVDVGTWDGTTCTIGVAANDHAKSGATALTGAAVAGAYCVEVLDSGNVPADWTVTFTVQVTHP